MVTLYQLLNEAERKEIKKYPNVVTGRDIRLLTVQDLSDIALLLMASECWKYNRVPETVLPAKAIEILTNRAIEANLPIYT